MDKGCELEGANYVKARSRRSVVMYDLSRSILVLVPSLVRGKLIEIEPAGTNTWLKANLSQLQLIPESNL